MKNNNLLTDFQTTVAEYFQNNKPDINATEILTQFKTQNENIQEILKNIHNSFGTYNEQLNNTISSINNYFQNNKQINIESGKQPEYLNYFQQTSEQLQNIYETLSQSNVIQNENIGKINNILQTVSPEKINNELIISEFKTAVSNIDQKLDSIIGNITVNNTFDIPEEFMNKINSIDSSLSQVTTLPESQEKILLAITEQKTVIEKLLDKNRIIEINNNIPEAETPESTIEEEKTKIDSGITEQTSQITNNELNIKQIEILTAEIISIKLQLVELLTQYQDQTNDEEILEHIQNLDENFQDFSTMLETIQNIESILKTKSETIKPEEVITKKPKIRNKKTEESISDKSDVSKAEPAKLIAQPIQEKTEDKKPIEAQNVINPSISKESITHKKILGNTFDVMLEILQLILDFKTKLLEYNSIESIANIEYYSKGIFGLFTNTNAMLMQMLNQNFNVLSSIIPNGNQQEKQFAEFFKNNVNRSDNSNTVDEGEEEYVKKGLKKTDNFFTRMADNFLDWDGRHGWDVKQAQRAEKLREEYRAKKLEAEKENQEILAYQQGLNKEAEAETVDELVNQKNVEQGTLQGEQNKFNDNNILNTNGDGVYRNFASTDKIEINANSAIIKISGISETLGQAMTSERIVNSKNFKNKILYKRLKPQQSEFDKLIKAFNRSLIISETLSELLRNNYTPEKFNFQDFKFNLDKELTSEISKLNKSISVGKPDKQIEENPNIQVSAKIPDIQIKTETESVKPPVPPISEYVSQQKPVAEPEQSQNQQINVNDSIASKSNVEALTVKPELKTETTQKVNSELTPTPQISVKSKENTEQPKFIVNPVILPDQVINVINKTDSESEKTLPKQKYTLSERKSVSSKSVETRLNESTPKTKLKSSTRDSAKLKPASKENSVSKNINNINITPLTYKPKSPIASILNKQRKSNC